MENKLDTEIFTLLHLESEVDRFFNETIFNIVIFVRK